MSVTYYFDRLDKDSLDKLYSQYGLRCSEIGSLVGVTEDAVYKALRSYGIPTNPKSKQRANVNVVFNGSRKDIRKKLTDDVLRALCLQGLTDAEIGLQYNMTGEGVAYRRRKIGISPHDKPRTSKDAASRLCEMSIEELSRLYYGNSTDKISEILGASKTVWLPIVRERGLIDKGSKRIASYPDFTSDQYALIIGGLLGDGGIDEQLSYYEHHSVKQEWYLRSKMKILEPYTSSVHPTTDGGFRFTTVCHPHFRLFRDAFYAQGIKGKQIPLEFIAAHWDDRILAYWFLDDGSYDDETSTMKISNFCQDHGQLVSFTSWLESRFGWGFHCGASVVTISKKFYRQFFELVLKVATPDVLYKVPEEYLTSDLVQSAGNIGLYPKFYRLGSPEIKAIMEKQLFDSYWGKPFPHVHISVERQKYLACNFKELPLPSLSENGVVSHSTSGMVLCESFFPCMYSAHRKGLRSPEDLWMDEAFMRDFVRNRLTHADRINDASMRKGFKVKQIAVSNFKPSVARFVWERYGRRGRVLDYSGGYGARMLGAMSSGMEYVCFEPCSDIADGLDNFGRFLHDTIGGSYEVVRCGSETAVVRRGYFDVAFSSPPYFDYEWYSDEGTQSIVKFPVYDDWLSGYWRATIENCVESLADDGVFAVCLSDQDGSTLLSDTERICSEIGLYQFERMCVPFMNVFSGRKYEVILSYSKKPSKDIVLP